jgi:ABC-type uncharacterized transport system permease subunit
MRNITLGKIVSYLCGVLAHVNSVVYSFFLGTISIWTVKNGNMTVKVKHFRPSLGLVHQHPFMIGNLHHFYSYCIEDA